MICESLSSATRSRRSNFDAFVGRVDPNLARVSTASVALHLAKCCATGLHPYHPIRISKNLPPIILGSHFGE
jgi:hypothetical protein